VKNDKTPIDFEDILWLRRASSKAGAASVPPAVAEKLIAAGLIEHEGNRSKLKITEKGRIALSKLG
jgi:hypothetical protein